MQVKYDKQPPPDPLRPLATSPKSRFGDTLRVCCAKGWVGVDLGVQCGFPNIFLAGKIIRTARSVVMKLSEEYSCQEFYAKKPFLI